MDRNQLLSILLMVVAVAVLLLLVAIVASRRLRKRQMYKTGKRSKGKRPYIRFLSLPLIGLYFGRIKYQLEATELADEEALMKKTMEVGSICLGISLLLLTILILMDHGLLFLLMSLVVVYMVQDQLVRFFIERLENTLLRDFLEFLSCVRHKYNEHHMVDEAIYDAIDEVGYGMARHGERMYETLTDEHLSVEDYYDVAPNKYFKSFVALAFLVLKFGDQKIEESSSFLRNMNYLKQEISMELLQREKISYLLSSMSLMTVLPLFLVKPLEKWAMGSMPDLMNYYQGAYGYVTQIVLFLLVVLSYQLIIRLRKIDTDHTPMKQGKKMPRPIGKWIGAYIHNHYAKANALNQLLKLTGTKESVEQFYYRRLRWGLLGFLLALFVILNLHSITKTNLLERPYISSEMNYEETVALERMDASFIRTYTPSDQAIIAREIKSVLELKDDQAVAIHVNRILEKMTAYNQAYLKWWQFVLAIGIGLAGGYLPMLILQFQKGVMMMHMEDEVLTFHTLILMLMPIKRMAVVDLLEWMALFANIFKEDIQECLNDYELGDLEALEGLKQRSHGYEPFIRIVENLQATADKITIAEAFDELIVERSFYQEKRKQDTDILIQKKGAWGKLIAFVPMVMTIGGFLLIPFTHLGIHQFNHYLSEMTLY